MTSAADEKVELANAERRAAHIDEVKKWGGVVPGGDHLVEIPYKGADPPLHYGSVNPSYFSFHVEQCSVRYLGQEKILLNDVSGYCKPGESLAILGPSGAGKSTLLDILAYRKTIGKWRADMKLNGISTNGKQFVRDAGYVTADDLLHPELTVRETLMFHANLRLPRHLTLAERKARVDEVLLEMHLTNAAGTKVGSALSRGLSTGERKRLNIAIELLHVSTVLFLDEPTTGLDSNTGREVINHILGAARARKLATIATIHQPSYTILRQFDRLLLLCGGKVAYFGAVDEAIQYFEAMNIPVVGNPAEVYSNALAAQPTHMVDVYNSSALKTLNDQKITSIHNAEGSVMNGVEGSGVARPSLATRAGFHQVAPGYIQTYYLMKRQVTVYSRNLIMSTSRYLGAAFVGVFFGGAFWHIPDTADGYDAKSAIIFAAALFVPLFNVAAISYWLEKRKLYYHEIGSGMYHPFYYLLTSFLVEIVFLATMMWLLCIIMFPMAGFQKQHLGHIIGYITFECVASTGFSLFFYSIAPSIPYANAAFNLAYFYSQIFNGYYVQDNYRDSVCHSCEHFWQWFSYMRGFQVPTMRIEFEGQPLGCSDDQTLPINLAYLSGNATQALANDYIANFTSTNTTLNELANSDPSAYSATITSLVTTGSTIAALNIALLVANEFSNPANYTGYLNATITALSTEFAAGINVTDPQALAVAVSSAYNASNQATLSEAIPSFGLPDESTCIYQNGSDYLRSAMGFVDSDFYTSPPPGSNANSTGDSFFMGANVMLGLLGFTLAYIGLVSCRFQKK